MATRRETWIEVIIRAPEDLTDAVSNFMTEIGAQGVYEESLDIPDSSDFTIDFTKPDAEPTVKAYLQQDLRLDNRLNALDAYLKSLAALFPELPSPTYKTEVVTDADWAEGWKKYFKPVRATKNIVIKPTWERYNPCRA